MFSIRQKLSGWLALAGLHASAVALLSTVSALAAVGPDALLRYLEACRAGFSPDLVNIGIHVGVTALAWAVVVIVFLHVRGRRRKLASDDVIRTARGAIMVETLIALVPLLLLTAGIAQLTMINVANLLADLAAYKGARTAWIWEPETRIGRNSVTTSDVEFRARTAAAFALAPTAGSDHFVGRNFPRGSGPPFRRIRTAIAASFRPGSRGNTGAQEWRQSSSNWRYFQLKANQALPRETSFGHAFDSVDFHLRAARKCTMAWMNLRPFKVVRKGGKVGVHFTYKYNLIVPWFAYIFGSVKTSGMRKAYYVELEREFMFPEPPKL